MSQVLRNSILVRMCTVLALVACMVDPAQADCLQGYCRSTCLPLKYPDGPTNTGKSMRYLFSHKEWGDDPDMDVRCSDPTLSSEGMVKYSEMFKKMRQSIYCVVFPGDAASTRRLSEIFLAGCIPVFMGPPYHSMPFSETVRPLQRCSLKIYNNPQSPNTQTHCSARCQSDPTAAKSAIYRHPIQAIIACGLRDIRTTAILLSFMRSTPEL